MLGEAERTDEMETENQKKNPENSRQVETTSNQQGESTSRQKEKRKNEQAAAELGKAQHVLNSNRELNFTVYTKIGRTF